MKETNVYAARVFPRLKGRVFLVFHKKLGMWLPPGGKAEPGESPAQTASREIFEETGWSCVFPSRKTRTGREPAGYLGYGEHRRHDGDGRYLIHSFVADVHEQVPAPCVEYDHHMWVGRTDVDKTFWRENLKPYVSALALVAIAY